MLFPEQRGVWGSLKHWAYSGDSAIWQPQPFFIFFSLSPCEHTFWLKKKSPLKFCVFPLGKMPHTEWGARFPSSSSFLLDSSATCTKQSACPLLSLDCLGEGSIAQQKAVNISVPPLYSHEARCELLNSMLLSIPISENRILTLPTLLGC